MGEVGPQGLEDRPSRHGDLAIAVLRSAERILEVDGDRPRDGVAFQQAGILRQIDHALAQGSIVFSLLETTARAAIDYVLEVFPPIIDKLRRMSPLYTKYLEEKGS